ncbi:hypothetical protein FA15DRAFT_671846 [Coprinopsis marcescibilis]|uniref:Uncharacterized protein n=1 Tax=Coprinopsis marcescibilis TaxID=230819 RepID=A0A5C3KQ05_COPMA|nr:hypothetical protein FA15DRAFT_671846 [Coprinopsis marcescibilis]
MSYLYHRNGSNSTSPATPGLQRNPGSMGRRRFASRSENPSRRRNTQAVRHSRGSLKISRDTNKSRTAPSHRK